MTTAPEVPAYRLDADGAVAFQVDRESRVIRGLLVPYGRTARSQGRLFQFSQGSLTWSDPSRVKLWIMHDPTRAVGHAFELDDRPDGLFGAFKVARGAAGDEALTMAEDRVWDGFSIGLGQGGDYRPIGGVLHAVKVPIMETSLTPAPSFEDARVHDVAASAVHAPGKDHRMTTTATDAPTTDAPTTDPAPTFTQAQADGFSQTIRDAIAAGFSDLRNPQGDPPAGPAVVSAGEGVVRDELPYRFDGIPGAHCFTDDIRAAHFSGDSEARARLDSFMDAAFAVTVSNAAALNPNQNRPELYVPNTTYTRPLWDLVSTGTLTDKTPFVVPKFSSASGLVGDHSEGVEPTPGAFAATAQTITPTALSGKVEINREVWDQGGSPQADGIIWAEMMNGYFEAIEAKIAAALQGVATTELNLGSAVDGPLQAALTGYLAGLQFVRGGNRFTAFAADSKLFGALVGAVDASDRPLFPVVAPANAQGSASGAFDRVAIGSQEVRAAWALAQLSSTRSFNFVPGSVWAWASAPKRFTFEYQTKSVDMAVWGYVGTAVLRESDVKPVDYDVAD